MPLHSPHKNSPPATLWSGKAFVRQEESRGQASAFVASTSPLARLVLSLSSRWSGARAFTNVKPLLHILLCSPPASSSRWVSMVSAEGAASRPSKLTFDFCADDSVGPFVLGAMVSTVLLGINSSQVWSEFPHSASFDAHRSPSTSSLPPAAYYRAFPHDRKLYRYLVGFLWCVPERQRVLLPC